MTSGVLPSSPLPRVQELQPLLNNAIRDSETRFFSECLLHKLWLIPEALISSSNAPKSTSLQGKGVLLSNKQRQERRQDGPQGMAGDNPGLQSWEDTARLSASTRELPKPGQLIMQGIWLLDSPEAGGDAARRGGNDHISNSPKARGLLLSGDGHAFQPTVHTWHV